jgi:hypothetical protein
MEELSMSNAEKDNLFEEVVNEGAEDRGGRLRTDVVAGGIRKESEQTCEAKPDFWDEVRKQTDREYRMLRVKGFFRALVEVGGYVALGGVMLAAQLLDLVPAYVAVPVYQVSWIWSAIRMDRFFRR